MNPAPRIFVSYSHRGQGPAWKAKLLSALKVFADQHLLDFWDDERIRASQNWHREIAAAMTSADAAIILLTPEALTSDYILQTELPFLRQRWEADKDSFPIFPVICEPCDWKENLHSRWLHAIQSPAGAEPLSTFPDAIAGRHLRRLATTLAQEFSRLALSFGAPPSGGPSSTRTYLDKFPLTRAPGLREEKLIGREQELALLDLALASSFGVVPPSGGPASSPLRGEGSPTAIVSLVAWGGVGKTMLVQHWLRRLERQDWFGARRVYAWSFYSQGTKEDRQASEDLFLAEALQWFGVQCEPTFSPWDKGRLLADAASRERTLLILDGIEPLQYPPGPMGGQLRAPGLQSLLKQLASKANSFDHRNSTFANCLCLVTTREPLTDLADFQRREGSPWGSVLRIDLCNLTDEAGAALLHHAGANRAGAAEIKPDDHELLAASREVDGHALTLNLLGRFLARAHSSDIRRRDLVKFEEADRAIQGGTTFKLLAAFESWFANEGEIEARSLTIMRLLGLFDHPADAGCMTELRKPPIIAGLTDPLFTPKRDSNSGQITEQSLSDKAWNDVTHFLSNFGLIVIHADSKESALSLDCHPLIREHFALRVRNCNPEGWRSGHQRLYEYLRQATIDEPKPALDDLIPLYRAIKHACNAGRHEEARLQVFWHRILRMEEHYSWRQLGAWSEDLSAIATFFERPWSKPVRSLPIYSKALVLGQCGSCLLNLGRLQDALAPMQEGAGLMYDLENWEQASIGTGNLCELQLAIGDLEEARRLSEMAVSFAKSSRNPEQCINRLAAAGLYHTESGRSREAEDYYQKAELAMAGIGMNPPWLLGIPGFGYCDMRLVNVERLAWKIVLAGGIECVANYRPTEPTRREEAENHVKELQRSLSTCQEVGRRAQHSLRLLQGGAGHADDAFDNLTLARVCFYEAALEASRSRNFLWRVLKLFTSPNPHPVRISQRLARARSHSLLALDHFRRASQLHQIPRGLLTRAWLCRVSSDGAGAQADLDEAWDIAERGPMRLHMADIHLHRARLFFREKQYPWQSPQADLAAAEQLINECGYHRRDQELADAKRAILGP